MPSTHVQCFASLLADSNRRGVFASSTPASCAHVAPPIAPGAVEEGKCGNRARKQPTMAQATCAQRSWCRHGKATQGSNEREGATRRNNGRNRTHANKEGKHEGHRHGNAGAHVQAHLHGHLDTKQ
eukprot:10992792-Alexandrium_andersonii.AAC.1